MELGVRTWPSRLVSRRWLLAFAPINAATAGFGVVLPLLILIPLHRGWAEVAVAATLYNSIVILSSIVWGRLSDRFPFRRLFLVVNYAGFAGLYAVLAHLGSLTELYLIYALIGAVAPAGANASNLLILEKFTVDERATAFASFQEVSMIGALGGLLLGYFWTTTSAALLPLLWVLAALALASAVAIWFGISPPERRLTPAHVASHPSSLLSRLRPMPPARTSVPFFPHWPRLRPDPFGRLRRWAREELHHELPLIMIASFLFNLSANVFNIAYTPFLYSAGLTAGSIFLVNLSNNSAQALVFPVSGGLANRIGIDRLVHHGTYFRSLGYLATVGLTFVVLGSRGMFGANLAIYAVIGGAIALYTTASTLMLFRGFGGRDAGGLLGINSALGGVAAVAGAALSGLLALFGSFRLVFLVSSAILLVSLPLWTAATVAYGRRRAGDRPATAVPVRGSASSEGVPVAKAH